MHLHVEQSASTSPKTLAPASRREAGAHLVLDGLERLLLLLSRFASQQG
jgi:hypothetical protein